MAVEVAMQWNESYGESVYTFEHHQHPRGRHARGGLPALLTSVVNIWHDKKLLKNNEKLTGEDIREGLAAIISVKLVNPQFEADQDQAGNTRSRFVQKVATTGCRTG